MSLKQEQRGFVLSGVALLLVLPAMLLAASFLNMVETGGEGASIQAVSDKVFYTGYDLVRMIRQMDNRGLPINSETLTSLADNFQVNTGLIVNLPGIVVYPIWIHVNNNGVDHFAGTRYCRITKVASEVWEYNFEDKDEVTDPPVDYDYNEPRLQVEKIGGDIRVTFLGYEGGYNAVVYYRRPDGSDTVIYSDVRSTGSTPAGSVTVENAIELHVPLQVMDPGGAARYSATVPLANQ
ncbi:MAG: hypothetical protein AB1305_01150 [Candidatus Hadarchaeota archaeon]